MTDEVVSYCRICGALCGVRVTLDFSGRISTLRGDKQNPHSRGYACFKGVQTGEIYDSPDRLRYPLKRSANGSFERIPLRQALDEIAQRLREHLAVAPQSVATFRGTANWMDGVAYNVLPGWMAAIGSPSFFSTMSIDQSAKSVTALRMGAWAGGRHEFENSDVFMLVGKNPLVSNWGAFGGTPSNPMLSLKEAKARGMTLIIVDPRRTETALFADYFLQIKPGEDVTLAAGMLRVIFAHKAFDVKFCEDHVAGLDALMAAVEPFTPDYVRHRAGIEPEQLEAATLTFARGRRGSVNTGTGPDMADRSNLAEHLYDCINIVCGRFFRAGEEVSYQRLLAGRAPLYAQVVPPTRPWEHGHKSRIRDTGMFRGEMMTGILPDEILTPGECQIRALIIDGGNPANGFPDRQKTLKALQELDLLVCIDPFMSETATFAHYILPPLLPYERPDVPLGFPMPFTCAFAQYTPAVVEPPADSELIDDWEVFYELAKRLGLTLTVDGVALDMAVRPSRDEMIALLSRHSEVPLEEVHEHPHGKVFDLPPQIVQPAQSPPTGRFQVAPSDIVSELADVVAETDGKAEDYPFRLISRRMREVMNTTFRNLPMVKRRTPYNPAYLNSEDIALLGVAPGDRLKIASDHGAITAVVAVDDDLRQGVVSMSHGWGVLDPDEDTLEASTSDLVSTDRNVEIINAMPRMSAIPVKLAPINGKTA